MSTRPVEQPAPQQAGSHAVTHPTVVAITGASAVILGVRLVQELVQLNQPIELIVSGGALPVLWDEMSLQLGGSELDAKDALIKHIQGHQPAFDPDKANQLITWHSNKMLGAPPASGTHLTRGMVIIPCSMTTLGKLASGVSDNLVTRAADVCLKERRKLILVTRETPLNGIHLENMLKLHREGALILPPMLSFYDPAYHSLEGQLMYTVAKVLDHLDLRDHGLTPRWSGLQKA